MIGIDFMNIKLKKIEVRDKFAIIGYFDKYRKLKNAISRKP